MCAFCWSYPSATFASQHHGGFVSREWKAAKGPISRFWQDSILRGFIFAMLTGKYEKKGITYHDLRATVRKYRPSTGTS